MKLNELKKAAGKRVTMNLILTDVSEGIGEDGKSLYSFSFTDTVLGVEGRMPARYAKDEYFDLIGKTVFVKAVVQEDDEGIYLSVSSVTESADGEIDVSCTEEEKACATGKPFPVLRDEGYRLIFEKLVSGCSAFLEEKSGDMTIRQRIFDACRFASDIKPILSDMNEDLLTCITAFWCIAGEYEKKKNGIAAKEAGLARGQIAALLAQSVAGTVKGEKGYDLTKVGLLEKALMSLDALKSAGTDSLAAALFLVNGEVRP